MADFDTSYEGHLNFQIRVSINISHPQFIRFYFKHDSWKIWASIRYERLPFFCVLCGIIDHVFCVCPYYYKDDHPGGSIDFMFCMWLLTKFPSAKEVVVGASSGSFGSSGHRLPLEFVPYSSSPSLVTTT